MFLDVLRGRLLGQAYLFDDPRTYEAGVEDALAALEEAQLLRTTVA